MISYKIGFIGKPDSSWVDAAAKTLVTPRAVLRLLKGSREEIVNELQLDAIMDWDRLVAKRANAPQALEFWPAPIVAKGAPNGRCA